jgi:hypothetical protein
MSALAGKIHTHKILTTIMLRPLTAQEAGQVQECIVMTRYEKQSGLQIEEDGQVQQSFVPIKVKSIDQIIDEHVAECRACKKGFFQVFELLTALFREENFGAVVPERKLFEEAWGLAKLRHPGICGYMTLR